MHELAASEPVVVDPLTLDPWKLRVARTLAGLSQTQLAQRAGYKGGNARICLIEGYRDKKSREAKMTARLAAVLGVDPLDLMSTADDQLDGWALFSDWKRDGKPPLREWVRRNLAQTR